jgi:TonB-linked SusC/RagA family outer membrane protein
MKRLEEKKSGTQSLADYGKAVWNLAFLLGLMLVSTPAFSQSSRSVSGSVADAKGEAVIGATVAVKGKAQGTVTDVNGSFNLSVSSSDVLVISYIGYNTAEVSVGNKTAFRITLSENTQALEEVVVVGYGTQRKATLTGAVSAVRSDEIIKTKNENVVNMLTGKLPGVRISQKTAQPGEFNTVIDIRGMGDPLIVVDGIPRDKDYFSRMDPNEIESVSVLKDASAAIYGLRSANGVLLITSKRGENAQSGKFDISYSINNGWQQFLYTPENVNAVDYMMLKNEQVWRDFNGNYMTQRPANFSDADIELWRGRESTSWVDAAFDKTSPQVQHNLSLNGSSEKIDYFFNLGYMSQTGAYKSKSLNYDRWNFRANIDAKVTKRLKLQADLSGYMDETNQPRTDIWAVYKQAWRQRPNIPIYANDNPLYPNYDMIDNENPVVVTDGDKTGLRTYVNRAFTGRVALSYDIPGVEGLSAKASYTYDVRLKDNTDLKKAYNLYRYIAPEYGQNGEIIREEQYQAFLKNSPSSINRTSQIDPKTLMQLSLNYKRIFGQHNVSALLLFEEEYSNWDSFSAYRELKVASDYLFAGEEQNQIASGGGVGDRLSQGIVGKFNYDYKGRYMAEFSFREDGSSRWPAGSRWGFFPSGSIGWRMSEESFIKDNTDILTNLKLRVSYGKLGDDRSGNNYPPTVVGYNLDGNDRGWLFDGTVVGGVSPTSIPNPSLTWYTSKTVDAGVDFELWDGRLGGTLDYYQRDREGLLDNRGAQLPGTVGASLPQENLNSDRTFGYEIELTHRNKVKNVSYYINTQVSTTKNQWRYKIETTAANSYDHWKNRQAYRYTDIWWGREMAGRFSSYDQIYSFPMAVTAGSTVPGDYYYEDWNGDGVINDNDNHPIATKGIPLINFGITTGAEWKDFDLSLNFQGASNVYVAYNEVLNEPLAFDGGALTMFLDRWHPRDTGADLFDPSTQWIPGYYPATGSPRGTGTAAIHDASYIRLKTLEVGYTLPRNWLSRVGVSNLRIYFSAYNLLTFTGLKYSDPEHPGGEGGTSSSGIDSYAYPINRTYNLGASIKF